MLYLFEGFELDISRNELRKDGVPRHVEPQVFALIELLIANHHRIVTKEEINASVWNGRIVSEAVLNSRIRSARLALDDNGRAQRIIKTHSRKGFRALVDVGVVGQDKPSTGWSSTHSSPTGTESAPQRTGTKPSIAIFPFQLIGDGDLSSLVAYALPHEIISGLSRLRWLRVISRSSAFQYDPTSSTQTKFGQSLNARYSLTGIIENTGRNICINVTVTNSADGVVIWSSDFSGVTEDVQDLRSEIVDKVVTQLDIYVPESEANLVANQPIENLTAWEMYHIGLQHLYRFTPEQNKLAAKKFQSAIAMNPEFSQAHSALALTEIVSALTGPATSHKYHTNEARRLASTSIDLDPLDPVGNLTMGRVLYLDGEVEKSADWINRALVVRPSYALGLYLLSVADVLTGDGDIGQRNVDEALLISPLDPHLSGMIGARCLSHIVRNQYEEASHWADRIMNTANASPRFMLISAAAYALGGDDQKTNAAIDVLRNYYPDFGMHDFDRNFPFRDESTHSQIQKALSIYGF
ncbi:winged helix-turn-helix domain-containing protein [uncultured Ruegeria sp.]|uniref:winged helix-turn-helix domain-containing protein n=1 Tax=uncultured Ruegeria sp. TaxID=259304 RepID=UPI00260223E5|nr:winged helix-turn-helix domain-containing protein [uncultured Ruegeria sp.]